MPWVCCIMCWKYALAALILFYHSIAPCICRDDTSASTIIILEIYLVLYYIHEFPLSALVEYPAAINMRAANESKVVYCTRMLTFHSSFHFRPLNYTLWLRKETSLIF